MLSIIIGGLSTIFVLIFSMYVIKIFSKHCGRSYDMTQDHEHLRKDEALRRILRRK